MNEELKVIVRLVADQAKAGAKAMQAALTGIQRAAATMGRGLAAAGRAVVAMGRSMANAATRTMQLVTSLKSIIGLVIFGQIAKKMAQGAMEIANAFEDAAARSREMGISFEDAFAQLQAEKLGVTAQDVKNFVRVTDEAAAAAKFFSDSVKMLRLSFLAFRVALAESTFVIIGQKLREIAGIMERHGQTIANFVGAIVDAIFKIIDFVVKLVVHWREVFGAGGILSTAFSGFKDAIIDVGASLILVVEAVFLDIAAAAEQGVRNAVASAGVAFRVAIASQMASLKPALSMLERIPGGPSGVAKTVEEMTSALFEFNVEIEKTPPPTLQSSAAFDAFGESIKNAGASIGGFFSSVNALPGIDGPRHELEQMSDAVDPLPPKLTYLQRVAQAVGRGFDGMGKGIAGGVAQMIAAGLDIETKFASSIVGAWNSIEGAAVSATKSLLDGSASAGDAFRNFARAMLDSLLMMVAQMLVAIPVMLAFSAILALIPGGAAIQAAGAAGFASSLGAVMGAAGGFSAGGAGGGAPAAPAAQQRVAPMSAPGGAGGGTTNVTIQTMDAKSFSQFVNQPDQRATLRQLSASNAARV